jgi:hypothetical protein
MRAISIFSLAVLAVFLNCGNTQVRHSFEGEITYKISFLAKSANENYLAYQKQKYGDSLRLTICNDGAFRRDYFTSGPTGFDFYIYDPKSNMSYVKWRNIDTIYSFSCALNSLDSTNASDLQDQVILNEMCSGYMISGKDSKGGQSVSLSYYYPNNKEYINPAPYANFKDFFFDKITARMQAPYYKLLMNMTSYEVTFEAVAINEMNTTSSKYELPSGIPIKSR